MSIIDQDFVVANKEHDLLMSESSCWDMEALKAELLKVIKDKKKPESQNSGSTDLQSVRWTVIPSNIASPQNTCNGFVMTTETFPITQIHKALQNHPVWQKALTKHRHFFLELLLRCAQKKTVFDLPTGKIILEPGDYCSTERRMTEEFSPVGQKDGFSKNDIRGAIKYFSQGKLMGVNQKVNQKVNHQNTILTICVSEICGEVSKKSQPESQPESQPPLILYKQESPKGSFLPKRKLASKRAKAEGGRILNIISFNRQTKNFENITEEDMQLWRETYPTLNVNQELLKMKNWLLDPDKPKRQGSRGFIAGWLNRAVPGVSAKSVDLTQEKEYIPEDNMTKF